MNKISKIQRDFLKELNELQRAWLCEISDKDRDLSGTVLSAQRDGRIFQLTIDEGVEPAAFFKKTGLEFDKELLQVIAPYDNVKFIEILNLFDMWIVECVGIEDLNRNITKSVYFV